RLGQVRRVPLGLAVGDPGGDQLFVFVAQAALVAKLAVLGVRVPGGHATLVDHFLDHLAPARHFVVAGQRERPDPAGAMTFDALVFEDPRDLLRIGHLAVRRDLGNAADQTAHGVGLGHAHRLTGQQLVNGLGDVAAGEVRLAVAGAGLESVLVVDAAAIAHHAL